MALSYTPYPDGAKMELVRNKLNSFNSDVVLEVNNILQELGVLDTRITTNTTNVTDLQNRVTILEDIVDYYEYDEYINIDVPSDTYTEVASLHRTDIPDGVYEIKLLGTYSYDSTTNSAYLRVSFDNGNTWDEFQREPKDKTDKEVFNFTLPVSITTGVADIIVEGKKEDTGKTFTIYRLDIVVDKKR